MITAMEIEKAIEKLPEPEQRKLAAWFGDHRLMVEASEMLCGTYDGEDGGENQLIED